MVLLPEEVNLGAREVQRNAGSPLCWSVGPCCWGKGARMTFRNAIVTLSTPVPNALVSIRPLALFSRTRYPRVPGEIEGRGKKGSNKRLLSVPSALSCSGTAGMWQADQLNPEGFGP